jgi:environmental stress-induced protein Ves
MTTRIIRAGDVVRVPWKNGGGTTAEIAAFPQDSNFDTFGWRISMADVTSDGPFSTFPGVDRTLIVVEGNGIELNVGGTPHCLNNIMPKFSFSGDALTFGRLISGPIRDLNVMTRRGAFRHRTRFVRSGVALLSQDIGAAFIVALDSALDVTMNNAIHSLQILDTLALEPTQEMILLSAEGRAMLIEIAPDDAS